MIYLHFYKGYHDSYKQLQHTHDTTSECADCLTKKGGYIVKAQDIKVEA